MTCWDYRVLKTTNTPKASTTATFSIAEVYYEEDRPVSFVADVFPLGDTMDELAQDLRHMLLALDRPVLNREDLEKYQSRRKEDIP